MKYVIVNKIKFIYMIKPIEDTSRKNSLYSRRFVKPRGSLNADYELTGW
jgi:hypothetical protein